MNKDKIQKLITGIDKLNLPMEDAFKSVEEEMKKVAVKLRSQSDLESAKQSSEVAKTMKTDFMSALNTLGKSFEKLKQDLEAKKAEFLELLNGKLDDLESLLNYSHTENTGKIQSSLDEITQLKTQLDEVSNREVKIPDFGTQIKDIEAQFTRLVLKSQDQSTVQLTQTARDIEQKLESLAKELEKLRAKTLSALNNHGGNANRNININSSIMSKKYTDIDFVDSSSIGWTSSDVNGQVRITASLLSASGGSGTPGGSDTQLQFNDGGSFGGASVLTWGKNSSMLALNGGQKITVANTNSVIGLDITQNDTTNNTRGARITNAGTGNALLIDQNGNASTSTSTGGAVLLENTGSTGAGVVIYSNNATATGRLLAVTADNVGFATQAVYIQQDGTSHGMSVVHNSTGSNANAINIVSTNPNDTTLGLKGRESGKGTIKVTHEKPDGTDDADASSISINLDRVNGAETSNAQGIFMTSTHQTEGKLLNLRNNGIDMLVLGATSVLTLGTPGSVLGAIDLSGGASQKIRIQAASTAGAWTFTLPVNDGSSGQYLLTDGNGVTQWASVLASAGITRTRSVLSVSSTLAAASATDYVFFTNVGVNLTLPTALSNTNLYTIKNTAASSVLVSAPAGQDIDGSTTALMTTVNQSLSFISNGSVWGVV